MSPVAASPAPSRRTVLAGGVLLWPALVGSGLLAGCSGGSAVDAERAASPGFLNAIADIVIAPGTPPGVTSADLGTFVEKAFTHELFGANGGTAAALEAVLDARVPGSSFMKAVPAARLTAVTALDRETYAKVAPPPVSAAPQIGKASNASVTAPAEPEAHRLWRQTKQAMVVGYYTSEPGASVDLVYELVPGRYDADIPVDPARRYLSNNWMANLG